MTTKKIIPGLIVTLILLGCTGCSEEGFFSLERPNPTAISPLTYWDSEENAIYAVTAVYSSIRGITHGEGPQVILNGGTEDMVMRDTKDQGWLACHYHSQESTTQNGLENVWGNMYNLIFRANYFLENVDKVPGMDPALKERLVGEVKFLRGMAYFYLVVQYRNVPLVLATPTGSPEDSPEEYFHEQAPPDQVWGQVELDLSDALAVLPDSYESDDLGRATSAAAAAYLGKTYLYQQKWSEAAAELEKIIDGDYGSYQLMEDFSQNFDVENAFNSESVFETTSSLQGGTNMMPNSFGYPGYSARTMYIPSDWIMELFREEKQADGSYDHRFVATIYFTDPLNPGPHIYTNLVSGVADTLTEEDLYFRKYCDFEKIPDAAQAENNIRMMRYADVLLMYAEAKAESNEADAQAMEAVNLVRNRAGLESKSWASPTELMDEIRRQRALEFVLEEIRVFDLKRWGILKEQLSSAFPDEPDRWAHIDANRLIWPIPENEMLVNENLEQNEGY
jgi:hypothetical protein